MLLLPLMEREARKEQRDQTHVQLREGERLLLMMGSKQRSFALLVNVSLENLVPADHFYRHLERTLDLSFVREFVQETYAGGGRPSIDPVVFFKLQLVMFFEGIVRCANRIS